MAWARMSKIFNGFGSIFSSFNVTTEQSVEGPSVEKEPVEMEIVKGHDFKFSLRTTIKGLATKPKRATSLESMSVDPRSDKDSEFTEERYDDYGEGLYSLCLSRHEKLPQKDFSREIRGLLDVQKFLNKMFLLINLNNSTPHSIIHECLIKILGTQESLCYAQAKEALFTQDNVNRLSNTIHGTINLQDEGFAYDQNWICAMCNVPSLNTREVAIARLLHPANIGQNSQEVIFFILILAPTKEKGTKTDVEVGRTFGTIFSDATIRSELLKAHNEEEFRRILKEQVRRLAHIHSQTKTSVLPEMVFGHKLSFGFMKGVCGDLKRRKPHYLSDYVDGIRDCKSVTKTLSCSLFLYFACVLPAIAFGVLNDDISKQAINVEKVLISQVIGGLLFAVIGGTPHIILLTTAPLALYTSIIKTLSEDYDIDFEAFFGCVGLFNSLFLIIYSVFGLSSLMSYSTRSSEEIFSMFISIAFMQSAFYEINKNWNKYYECDQNLQDLLNKTAKELKDNRLTDIDCQREVTVTYMLLMIGTLWIGVTLFLFKQTPYLNSARREILSDYALPISVMINAALGIFLFKDVKLGKSFVTDNREFGSYFELSKFSTLSPGAIGGAAGLGFCLSLLFFMDQNISAALVNAPKNKLKKGTSYHWDLLVIAFVNGVLSLFCLPWVHAALPHSPLHVMALAETAERVDRGHISQIVVRVRETRMAAILSHILIGLSFLFLSTLSYIPQAVLYGLFLYVAVTGLFGNQLFERVLLFFTEQSAYPPNHYIRRVPQKYVHLFTASQLIQLIIVCVVGFFPFPYLKMFFPVLIFLLIPFRQKIIPKIFNEKYLKALDNE